MSSSNGTVTPRKTLASQLDRFDLMLDGLSEGLNEAVSDAVADAVKGTLNQVVRETVQTTLHAVIGEILTRPETLRQIHETISPPPSNAPTECPQPEMKEPGFWKRSWIQTSNRCQSACNGLRQIWAIIVQFALFLWTFKGSVTALTLVGGTVALGSYAVGPVFSAVIAGLGGIAVVVMLAVGLALQRAMTTVSFHTQSE